MPRDVSGNASAPAGTDATSNTTILSSAHNTLKADIYAIFNSEWPVSLGGTGTTDASSLDGTWRVKNTTDPTKKVALDLSGLTTATTRTYVAPDKNGTVALTSDILVPKGHIYGLTTSNNASDANNDIDIAAGECASDATTPTMLVLASSLTKRLDAAWAVGTGNGGLDTGSKANSTWYYIWLIRRSDTGVVDALFSASATSPTMPTNYDQKRRIGAVRTDGSGNILPFSQNGKEFTWATSILDYNTSVNTTAVLVALSVPPLAHITAKFRLWSQNTSSSWAGLVTSSQETDQSPSSQNADFTGVTSGVSAVNFFRRVNSSAQVRVRANAASTTININTFGWTDSFIG